MNILVSACLMAVPCRYDGSGYEPPQITELKKHHRLIPFCPEVAAGLSVPRMPNEILNGRVITKDGTDLTASFDEGAQKTLEAALKNDCTIAILKQRSPSCGYGQIYDGTFSGKLITGNGITAQLLHDHTITVISEYEINDFINSKE
ncbi:hypothetical protein SDC9_132905 [bioreactor metagenome]|uniref:Uncharacterized protein n=1 Tax=bioreactor metagenome TaxID=1076179 RepID=A0A645DA69_9ZZZZ